MRRVILAVVALALPIAAAAEPPAKPAASAKKGAAKAPPAAPVDVLLCDGQTKVTVLPEVLRFLAQWRLVIYSLVLILFMVFRPGGIMGRHEIGELIRFRLPFRRGDLPRAKEVVE